MLHVCFPQRFMTLMLLIETSQLVALHTWKNQHVYAHRAATEKNMVIHGRDKCLAVMLNKMHITNSTLCFRLRWRRRWVQSLFCLCVSVCIYSEGQFMREPTSVGRTFFFVFQMCVCVWCRLWKVRVPKRRSSTGWVRSTGTWCRVEIEVRQVEETDHVSFYAPAVSSMERANHQQRPLASAPPPTHHSSPFLFLTWHKHTHMHNPLN